MPVRDRSTVSKFLAVADRKVAASRHDGDDFKAGHSVDQGQQHTG